MNRFFRPTLLKRSMRRFNVAWWAYSFPLTLLALASTEHAQEVKGDNKPVLMLSLLFDNLHSAQPQHAITRQ